MTALVSAGAGFLLAVLWFDLMFDMQVARHRARPELPEEVLGSIAAYYRRVTTEARPMNRLVSVAMLVTVAGIVVQLAQDDVPRWVGWGSLGLACAAMLLAALRTVPRAVRLGAGRDPVGVRTRLARAMLRDHLLCLGAIAALLVLQVGFGR